MKMHSRFGGIVLVFIAIGALLLSSCSTKSPATSEKVAETKPYGSLKIAGVVDADIDPQESTPGRFKYMAIPVLDSLIRLSSNAQMTPGLAERWEISADGLTQTFYIRQGVKFQDGSDLTGEDVKFSFERIIAPGSIHTYAVVWRSLVASVELKDAYTVALHLKQQRFELLDGFQDMGGNTAVLPKKYIEQNGVDYFRKHPMGSGPFKVLNYTVGNRIEYEAMDSHWRAVPKFKNITQLNVPEEATKVAMLKTGELDMAPVLLDSVSALKTAGLSIVKHNAGSQGITYMFYDLDNPQAQPLVDVRVRKALSLSVNRQELGDKLYGGSDPGILFYVPKTAYFFDPNVLKPDPYDSEGAKKLLADAGYANGFSTKVWSAVGRDPNFPEAVAGYWRKIGVGANTVPIELPRLQGYYRPKPQPDAYNTIWPVVTTDSAFGFERMAQAYHSVRGGPIVNKNLKLDELIDKVPQLTDPAEKKKLALEAAVMAKNGYNPIAFVDVPTFIAVGPKVGSVTLTQLVPSLPIAYETITHAK